MKKVSNSLLVLIVGLIAIVILSGPLIQQPQAVTQTGTVLTTMSRPSPTTESPTVDFALTVQDSKTPFAFVYNSQDNPTLYVHKGDIVNVTLTNTGTQPHDFTLQGYNIKTKVLSSGESDSIVFKADTTGTFTYYCSVPGHKDLGMIGQFVVQ